MAMFWGKLIIINLGIFVLWVKFLMHYMTYLSKNSMYLHVQEFDVVGQVEELKIDYNDLEKINQKINPILDNIRRSTFFRIFKVNFDSECNFWTQNMICNFSTCSICQCNEEEVPLPWKQDSISDTVNKEVKEDYFKSLTDKYNYSSNHWLVESELDNINGIFVNLLKNPETWTGYMGQEIWKAIYMENCFVGSIDNMCTEEKIFYKVVSGLHSNINLHLSHNYLDTDLKKNNTNKLNELSDTYSELNYYVNAPMAHERVISHPDRINNLFFLYSLVHKTLEKAEATLKRFEYETGNKLEDELLKKNITNFYEVFHQMDSSVKVNSQVGNNDLLKKFVGYNRIDELKMRFRNISSIIDCVGCQKCRLHGKLQIYGLATMMKILFDKNDVVKLKRNELIAFVNLASKINRSVGYLFSIRDSIKAERQMLKIKIALYFIFFLLVLFLINYYYLSLPKEKRKFKRPTPFRSKPSKTKEKTN